MADIIQWFPGHMAKATRQIKEDFKKIDVFLVIGDARCVKSSFNPEFKKIFRDKKCIYIYNKTDLADQTETSKWINYFKNEETPVVFTSVYDKSTTQRITELLSKMKENLKFSRELHIAIIGVPNVGKSAFINLLAKRNSAKTGNLAGVTRANAWIKLSGEYYLLDTPGILPTKFENMEDGYTLASIGSIKDTVVNRDDLAIWIIKFLKENYPQNLMDRYSLDHIDEDPVVVMDDIAKKRGFLSKGGVTDYDRCINTIIDEFKNGKMGRMTIEKL